MSMGELSLSEQKQRGSEYSEGRVEVREAMGGKKGGVTTVWV